ncbi:MAG: allantoicase [Deltaproteobacteria bacterium]|nr:MAG: allantoicase [Deltaproteobacteria bacterium]
MTDFLDLPDLACEAVGGAALACNDEFFAEKDNLLREHAAVWKDHIYTDRGKWMDGWETRRRRPPESIGHPATDGDHDWCIVRLGMPGVIRGAVVDTAYFRGNFPESCALHATEIDDALDLRGLDAATWTEILPRSQLAGDTRNTFAIDAPQRFTHVRLAIFPDGGVARLRIHGEVVPRWSRLRALGGPIDLAALEHGAVVETCSDMFFGSRNNLIKPGQSRSMADGWETRRRRGPGNDWAIVRLAAAGTIERLAIDTTHFRGNAPGRCTVEGIDAPGNAPGSAEQLTGWRLLLASPLQPHTRQVFDDELRRIGAVTHLKLSVFPDGGVARLRAYGELAGDPGAGLARLNALSADEARAALRRCCGAARWVEAMAAARPFEDAAALLRIAERTWWSLDEAAHREAFAAHPRIGETRAPAGGDTAWSAGEQRAAQSADAELLAELAEANRAYVERHGFLFIVCATGRSAASMLADLRARLPSSLADELRTAAEEQIKIARLRLGKLLGELA